VSVCECVCVCVCLELRGLYLFRLCGSVIRISSTCSPGLCVWVRLVCVSAEHRSGSPGALPLVSARQERGGGGVRCCGRGGEGGVGGCVCAETSPAPRKEVDVGQCQKTRELQKFQSDNINLGFHRRRKPGKSRITRPIPGRYFPK